MSQYYKCDNCGTEIDLPHKTLAVTGGGINIGMNTTVSGTEYHICEACWNDLGWGY